MILRYRWAPLALKLAGLSLAAGAAGAVFGDHGTVFVLGAFFCAVGFELQAAHRALEVALLDDDDERSRP